MSGESDRGGAGKQPPGASDDPNESGEWHAVRDSWVGEEPPPHGPAPHGPFPDSSIPPPIPSSRVVDLMLGRLAANDWEGTLLAASTLLERHPTHPDAQQCHAMATRALRRVYGDRLGIGDGQTRVPRKMDEHFSGADVRTRVVFRQVDGEASVDEIVEESHLDSLDTLRVLSELLLRNAITFED